MFNFIVNRGTNRRWVIEGGSWPIFSLRSLLVDVKLSKLTGLKSLAPVHLFGILQRCIWWSFPQYGSRLWWYPQCRIHPLISYKGAALSCEPVNSMANLRVWPPINTAGFICHFLLSHEKGIQENDTGLFQWQCFFFKWEIHQKWGIHRGNP